MRCCISSGNTSGLAGLIWGAALLVAPFAWAQGIAQPLPPDDARAAAIVFLGEQHDNPAHHSVQARWVAELSPKTVVFEMLTPEQAARITKDDIESKERLEAALDWANSGWPDFAMYHPIFLAAPDAMFVGAGVPRAQVRAMMDKDLADVFGPEASARFGLDKTLPDDQQTAREDLQRAAHCDALPEEMLPMMVGVQRLRDAALARAALDALDATGGPVAVITGNGHARDDWGAPYLVRFAAPDVKVFSLGQGEAGQVPVGAFGTVVDGPGVDRGDPCDAFR